MTLVQMSLSGAALILLIALLRALALHRLPKKAFMVLWNIALARLLLPYALPSALSVYSLPWRALPAQTTLTRAFLIVSPAPQMDALPTITPNAPTVDPWSLVWLLGALGCALFFFVTYWKCLNVFRQSLPLENAAAAQALTHFKLRRALSLRVSDRIAAPLTYGLLRPVILLPKGMENADAGSLRYVLAHESIHIRRFDNAAKLALVAALCLHWFNPAVWLMYALCNRDIELSCDEAVLHLLGQENKAGYALTLLRMEEVKSGLMPLCSHFSKNAMEERILAIMKAKKASILSLLIACTLIVCVATGFATTAMPEKTADPTEAQWWTAEEYAAWLATERIALQDCLGEKAWSPTRGWYTMTQEMIDEALSMYEQTLKDIQNGMKLSKPSEDGDTILLYSYNPDNLQHVDEFDNAATVFSPDKTGYILNIQAPSAELLEAYAAYGLTYDAENHQFFFQGKLVRYLHDGYTDSNGIASRLEFVNPDGVIDVTAIREVTQNADGGRLLGITQCSQEEFDNHFVQSIKDTVVQCGTI